jgi:hypothetical protein
LWWGFDLQIFKTYIEIELQLGNIDRCRRLYEKYLEWAPANCYAWSKFAELERSLGETERGRAIFELAIAQPVLDMPELLWKVGLLSFLSRVCDVYQMGEHVFVLIKTLCMLFPPTMVKMFC